jgi:hypothetical protein
VKTPINFPQDPVPEDCMVVLNQLDHRFKFCINNELRQVLLGLLLALVKILLILLFVDM